MSHDLRSSVVSLDPDLKLPEAPCSVFSPSTHSSATFQVFPFLWHWMQNGSREMGDSSVTSNVTECSAGKASKWQVACGLLGFLSPLLPALHPCFLLSPKAWETPSLAGGGLSQASCPCCSRSGSCPRLTWLPKAEGGYRWLKALLATSPTFWPGQD